MTKPPEPGECAAEEPEQHELTFVFTSLDPDHPFYLECTCGDLFRVDFVGGIGDVPAG